MTAVTETQDGVQVKAGGCTFTARYLVGADGAASAVARWLGLRRDRRLGGAIEGEVPLANRPDLESAWAGRALFSLGVVPWGYAWVFPRGDCLSVGVARFRPGHVDLRRALQREMSHLGIALDGVDLHGHPIPGYRPPPWPLWHRRFREPLGTRRCVLVGDAAGLVDPFIGEGIRYAMLSGCLAAEAIAGDSLAGYEAAVWREAGQGLATAHLVANLCYRWLRTSYRWGIRNPATVRLFAEVLSGQASYVGIGRRVLAATARWLIAGDRTRAAAVRDQRTNQEASEVFHDTGSGLSTS